MAQKVSEVQSQQSPSDMVNEGQRKLYIQMLNKLYLPDEVDENKLRKLKYLISSYKIVRRFGLADTG